MLLSQFYGVTRAVHGLPFKYLQSLGCVVCGFWDMRLGGLCSVLTLVCVLCCVESLVTFVSHLEPGQVRTRERISF